MIWFKFNNKKYDNFFLCVCEKANGWIAKFDSYNLSNCDEFFFKGDIVSLRKSYVNEFDNEW